MPQFPQAGPFNQQAPLVDARTGVATPDQSRWLLGLAGQVAAIQSVVNNALGTNFFPLASQPALGSGDVGYVGFVTDYAHLVYWDGSAWQWMDGDRPGRFEDFGAAPGTGWGLCDGSSYNLLVVGGATLTVSSFTTPDLSGTPAYRKSAAAYTGTVNAKAGATGTGTTGTGTTSTDGAHDHGGATGSHTHVTHTPATNDGAFHNTVAGISQSSSDYPHSHPDSVSDGATATIATDGDHTHSVPGLSVPALAVGSIEMANLGVLVYVRR